MKVFVITKKTLMIIAAAVIALLAAAAVIISVTVSKKPKDAPTAASVSVGSAKTGTVGKTGKGLLSSEDAYETEVLAGRRKELPVYSVERSDKLIALTIDAAWDDDKTPFILETISRYGIKATFFLCGFWTEAYPDQVRAIAEAGNAIGNHTMTHPHMTRIGDAEISGEILTLNDKIEALTGKRPIVFRAPYGEYDDRVIAAVRSLGMEPIQWDIDTIDWKPDRSSQTILDSVLGKLHGGAIILCHNNGYKIEEYLPVLIETALARGYTFVTVDELLLEGETIIDVNGVQKSLG